MNKEEFYILNSLYNGSIGREECKFDVFKNNIKNKNEIIKNLTKNNFINAKNLSLTKLGKMALDPYKVDNAIILAAGTSSRFVPLSLELPKGLYEVKGEKLIERQIKQLKAAGINNITLVIGYKKEKFYYLKEKYKVKFIINNSFNIKNNIESIYLCRSILKNTYICVSDNYFIENPFNKYEFESFNAGMFTKKRTNEMYVKVDNRNSITSMYKDGKVGNILLGHAFWTKVFANKFIDLVKQDKKGKYDNLFWEWLVKDNLNNLPKFYFKEYKENCIFEFDYFDDLRKFDNKYLMHTHSNIIRNIRLVFRCDENEIINFKRIIDGLTNTSFTFEVRSKKYIYRHPGENTDDIINRVNEKNSLKIAKKYKFDPTYVYADINEGWKISEYVKKYRYPNYKKFDDSKIVIKTLQKLHRKKISVDYGLSPWEDALRIENLLRSQGFVFDADYVQLKEKIKILYNSTKNDKVKKCFCHGDTYKYNWMILPNNDVVLIDWEYAGMADPGIDVGYYIVDAKYSINKAIAFIKEYINYKKSDNLLNHYLVYTALIAYYWYVWALYRKFSGADVEDSIKAWKHAATKFSNYLLN